jgi:hypothetical protein
MKKKGMTKPSTSHQHPLHILHVDEMPLPSLHTSLGGGGGRERERERESCLTLSTHLYDKIFWDIYGIVKCHYSVQILCKCNGMCIDN